MAELNGTKKLYDTYRRAVWDIENNNGSFFEYEIRINALVGGEKEIDILLVFMLYGYCSKPYISLTC